MAEYREGAGLQVNVACGVQPFEWVIHQSLKFTDEV